MRETSGRDVLKREGGFLIFMMAFALVNVLRHFEEIISEYNTTLFAMSYKYGFISRGMLGTIWLGLDEILPINLMTYDSVYGFACISTVVMYIIIFVMYFVLLRNSREKYLRNIRYLIAFFSIFTFSMFLTDEVFGRLDLWLYMLTFLMVILVLKDRGVWLVPILVGVCMCIHQGYVLTCANIIVVLMAYVALVSTGNKRKRYFIILGVTVLIMAVSFIYFEFFSHGAGKEIVDEVITHAKALSPDGKSYNESIINHEILGLDVYESEMEMHKLNWQEVPVFVVLFIPYIIIAGRFMRNLLRNDNAKASKEADNTRVIHRFLADIRGDKPALEMARWLMVLGGLAVVPQMLMKVDFGRYVYMTFSYYIVMTMCMLTLGDDKVFEAVEAGKAAVKRRTPFPMVVLIYPMFFMPLHDVIISGISWRVSTWVNFWMR